MKSTVVAEKKWSVETRKRSTRFRPLGSSGSVLAFTVVTWLGCAAAQGPDPPAAVFPSGATFHLEIADDDASRQIGYMYREAVGPHEGMLFIFDAPGQHPFWMRNCKVNLDIIWLDATHRVVEIAHDLAPCPAEGPCPHVRPMRAASYVLEVAGGTARREHLAFGDSVTLHLAKGQRN
jgi:hypothetical protein